MWKGEKWPARNDLNSVKWALKRHLKQTNIQTSTQMPATLEIYKLVAWHVRNEDSNQPAHPRSLIRVFVVCMKRFYILGNQKRAQWRFWSVFANAQADLNLRCAQICECTLFDGAAHIKCKINKISVCMWHWHACAMCKCNKYLANFSGPNNLLFYRLAECSFPDM